MSPIRAKESFTLSSDSPNVLAALDVSIASYYDGCTEEERFEQRQWGEFASAQLRRTQDCG